MTRALTPDPIPADDPVAASGLGVPQGAALTLGAVLGTGVISLPALAAREAGPASLVALQPNCGGHEVHRHIGICTAKRKHNVFGTTESGGDAAPLPRR